MKSNDKKRARIAAMQHVLSLFPSANKDLEIAKAPAPLILGSGALEVERSLNNNGGDADHILPRLS